MVTFQSILDKILLRKKKKPLFPDKALTPHMEPVDSSNIDSVGYLPEDRTLFVNFKGGGNYRYAGVPKKTHKKFVASDSKGRYFAQRIRNKFDYERLNKKPDTPSIIL